MMGSSRNRWMRTAGVMSVVMVGLLSSGCSKNKELLAAKESELQSVQAELEAKTGEVGAKESEIAALQAELEEAGKKESELEQLKSTLAEKEAELAGVQETLAEKESELVLIQEQAIEMESEMAVWAENPFVRSMMKDNTEDEQEAESEGMESVEAESEEAESEGIDSESAEEENGADTEAAMSEEDETAAETEESVSSDPAMSEVVAAMEAELAEQKELAEAMEAELSSQKELIEEKEAELAEQLSELSSQKDLSQKQAEEIEKQASALDEKDQQIEKQASALDEKDQQIEQQKKEFTIKTAELEEQLEQILGVREKIITELQTKFSDTDLEVEVNAETGVISLDPNVLFDFNSSDLSGEGIEFLKEFFPRYFETILSDDVKSYVSEIIVEGHTDDAGEYLYNLYLSQKRAYSVAEYCLTEEKEILPAEELEEVRDLLTANGRAFCDPVLGEDGEIDADASRRVEVKFRLISDDLLQQIAYAE